MMTVRRNGEDSRVCAFDPEGGFYDLRFTGPDGYGPGGSPCGLFSYNAARDRCCIGSLEPEYGDALAVFIRGRWYHAVLLTGREEWQDEEQWVLLISPECGDVMAPGPGDAAGLPAVYEGGDR